jgi:hypothetical protein
MRYDYIRYVNGDITLMQFFVQAYRSLKSFTALLGNVSLRLLTRNLRHFSTFGACPSASPLSEPVARRDGGQRYRHFSNRNGFCEILFDFLIIITITLMFIVIIILSLSLEHAVA